MSLFVTPPNPQPTSSASGSQVDGHSASIGATNDAAYTTGAGTLLAILKGIFARLRGGQATMTNSLPVTIASDQGVLAVSSTAPTSATATVSSVPGSATSGTLLAANASRKTAMLYNDSTAILYLLFGAGTASASNYTVQVPSGGYYELPSSINFTGILVGIWAAANGAVKVTELT